MKGYESTYDCMRFAKRSHILSEAKDVPKGTHCSYGHPDNCNDYLHWSNLICNLSGCQEIRAIKNVAAQTKVWLHL